MSSSVDKETDQKKVSRHRSSTSMIKALTNDHYHMIYYDTTRIGKHYDLVLLLPQVYHTVGIQLGRIHPCSQGIEA